MQFKKHRNAFFCNLCFGIMFYSGFKNSANVFGPNFFEFLNLLLIGCFQLNSLLIRSLHFKKYKILDWYMFSNEKSYFNKTFSTHCVVYVQWVKKSGAYQWQTVISSSFILMHYTTFISVKNYHVFVFAPNLLLSS